MALDQATLSYLTGPGSQRTIFPTLKIIVPQGLHLQPVETISS